MKKTYPFLIFFGILLLIFFIFKFILSSEIIEEIPISVFESDKTVIISGNNKLPIFDNLTLSILRSSNKYWIWRQKYTYEMSISNILDISMYDLPIKVTLTNPIDLDWNISYFKRYYYYKDDPGRLLEVKTTPSEINYTYFKLKDPGEYVFWVTIYDNDGGETVSEDVLWGWPIVLLVQDTKNMDIPIVTLKADKTAIEAWDEVTFDVYAKILSDRNDFDQEKTIKYDFDWDWERDLITKDNHVKYVYEKPNDYWYIPRVSVIYRWYEWNAKWWNIIVKDVLKSEPILEIVNELDNSQNTVDNMIFWWTEYNIAKSELIWILPGKLRVTIYDLFDDFEVAESNFEKWTSKQDERWKILEKILVTIKSKTVENIENRKNDEITKTDFDEIIMPNICKIITYFEITGSINICTELYNRKNNYIY